MDTKKRRDLIRTTKRVKKTEIIFFGYDIFSRISEVKESPKKYFFERRILIIF